MKNIFKFIIAFLFSISIKVNAQTHDLNDSLKWVKVTNLVVKYYSSGKTDSAILFALYGQELAISTFGRMHKNYISSINDLGFLYMSISQYEKSETYYLEALTFRKSLYGESHSEYWRGLNNLGSLYSEMGNLEKAKAYFSLLIQTIVKYGEKKNTNYVTYLNNLAKVYEQIGEYNNAETSYLEVYSIYENTRIETDQDYLNSLNKLANIYEINAKYTEAENLYKKALLICENKWGNQSTSYTTFLNNLSSLYQNMGMLAEAEVLQNQVLIILKKKYGEQHLNYAIALNNLAFTYFGLANYLKAETLYNQAIQLLQKINETSNTVYANALINMAALYNEMGNFVKAENLLRESLVLLEKANGKNHPDYALCLSTYAIVMQKKGDMESAIKVLQEAKKIYENKLGTSHFYYLNNLNILASIYQQTGKYKLAEELYTESLSKFQKLSDKFHPNHAILLNNLGLLHFTQKRYDIAINFFNESLKIKKKIYGQNSISYLQSANDLALIYYATNATNKLKNQMKFLLSISNKSQQILLSGFSENEKESYLQKNNYMSDIYHSILSNNNSNSTTDYYLNMVTSQAWLLQGKQYLNKLSYSSTDVAVKKILSDWLSINKKYAKAIQFTEERRKASGIDLNLLISQSQTLEKQLIESIPQFQSLISNNSITVKAISQKLKKNEALVHWVSFQYRSPEQWTDSVLYAAYIVLPKDTIPKFVTVFEEKQLQLLLNKYHSASSARSSLDKKKNDAANTDVFLYNLIWKPLLPYIKDATTIYNLPAGQLHKVSFAALTDSVSKKQLIDMYELHQLLTINELLNPLSILKYANSVVLFGGADYNFKSTSSSKSTDAQAPSYRNATNNKNISFNYLQGTKAEVETVAINANNTSWKTQMYIGSTATEDNLKTIGGENAPQILHIATHGFYFPPTKTKPSNFINDDNNAPKDFPLLRSGLVLSGANNYWGKDTLLENQEDGIVTAQEISNLNLLNTDLVVLSACQTALGDINGSEGVYGLQRAFKMAGAKKLLMSLWEVPDAETVELMQLFYNNVFKGDNYYTAFRKAQLTLKAKYKDPTKWAGFVLVGE